MPVLQRGQLQHAAGFSNDEEPEPEGEWAALVRRLSSSPDARRLLTALSVAEMRQALASSSTMAAAARELQEAGIVPALVQLLSSSDQDKQRTSLQLLNVMALAANNLQHWPGAEAALAAEARAALPALLNLFQQAQSGTEPAVAQAAGNVLRDLAALPPLRPVMAEHGALEAAVQHLQHGRLVPQAAGLLANLCQAPPKQPWGAAAANHAAQAAQQRRAAVAMGAVSALVQCLEVACSTALAVGGSEGVQEAARALASLMQFCPEGQAAAKQAGALSVLVHLLEQRGRHYSNSPNVLALLLALASSNDWRCMYKLGLLPTLRQLSRSSDSVVLEQAGALLRWIEEARAAAGPSAFEDPPVQPPQPQSNEQQRGASRQQQQHTSNTRGRAAPIAAAVATVQPQQAGSRRQHTEQGWVARAAAAAATAQQQPVANQQRQRQPRERGPANGQAAAQQHMARRQRPSEQRQADSAAVAAVQQPEVTHRQRQRQQQRAAPAAAAGAATAVVPPPPPPPPPRQARAAQAPSALPARTSGSSRNASASFQATLPISTAAEDTSGSQTAPSASQALPVPVSPATTAAAAPAAAPAAAGTDAAGGGVAGAAGGEAAELELLLQQLGVGDSASAGGTPAGIMSGGAVPPPPAALPEPAAAPAQVPATPAAAAASVTASATLPSSTAPAAAPLSPGLDPALLADLVCPLTLEPMREPVVAADGNTYERAAIEAWIARQQAAGQAPCSPLTGLPFSHLQLSENRLARSMIASLQAAGQLHHLS